MGGMMNPLEGDGYIDLEELLQLYYKGKKICVWGAGFLGQTTCRDILNKLKIQPYCFCDNNLSMINKVIYEDIKCIAWKDLVEEKDNIVFILAVRAAIQQELYCQLKRIGFKYIVPITKLSGDERVLQLYFPFMKIRIVAYTCVTNNYDHMRFPESNLLDKCDFYYISEKKPEELGGYKGWIDIKDVCPDSITDYTKMNRYCKINPHQIFSDYDYSIYYDGNIKIKNVFEDVFAQMNYLGIVMLSKTGHIDSYGEAAHKISQGVDNEEVIYEQIKRYWQHGMPKGFGSWHCGVMLRRHNSLWCRKIMEDWWEEVRMYSRRDQISFPYVLWKNGYKADDVGILLDSKDSLEKNDLLTIYGDHLRKIV